MEAREFPCGLCFFDACLMHTTTVSCLRALCPDRMCDDASCTQRPGTFEGPAPKKSRETAEKNMCHVKVDEKTEKISIALRKDDHRPVTAAAVTAARSRIECEEPEHMQKYTHN